MLKNIFKKLVKNSKIDKFILKSDIIIVKIKIKPCIFETKFLLKNFLSVLLEHLKCVFVYSWSVVRNCLELPT